MIKVFYDGKCGLCRREIAYYKKRDTQSLIDWIDVMEDRKILQQHQISEATALKHMHALMEDGQLVKGMDAFIAIWQRIPGWQWAASTANVKPIKILLDLVYEVFAYVRFKSYRHCRIAGR